MGQAMTETRAEYITEGRNLLEVSDKERDIIMILRGDQGDARIPFDCSPAEINLLLFGRRVRCEAIVDFDSMEGKPVAKVERFNGRKHHLPFTMP